MVNCVVCGRDLKTNEKWKTHCHECFKKTQLKGKKDINELIKKYGGI